MTNLQIEFLKLLNKNSMTAIELCQMLNIQPYKNDVGGYYNALNDSIGYLISDEGQEIDKYFTISFDNRNTALGYEVYQITDAGKQFLEKYSKDRFTKTTTIVGILIGLLSLIVAIISLW